MTFAASIPVPVHHIPGGLLATAIRDALTVSSFRAHMGVAPAPRPAHQRRGPTVAEQAMRAMRVSHIDALRYHQGNKSGRVQYRLVEEEARELLNHVRGLVDGVKDRNGWRHVSHVDPVAEEESAEDRAWVAAA